MKFSERIATRPSPAASSHVLQAALAAVGDSVAIADPAGRIVWVNQSFTAQTGYSPEEAAGQNLSILESGAHGPEFFAGLWRTVLAGGVWHGFIRRKRKDGSEFAANTTVQPVRDATGEIANLIVTSRAETPALTLVPVAVPRFPGLVEQFALLAEAAAHDLNDLLIVIQLRTAQRLARSQARGEDSEDLLMISDAGRRAADLVRRLLSFGPEATPRAGTSDLNRAIRDGLARLKRLIPSQITLIPHFEAELPLVAAKEWMLQLVVLNLVSHASDSMPDGGAIWITTADLQTGDSFTVQARTMPPGRYAMLTVTDNGESLDPAARRVRVQPLHSTLLSGTGREIGLSAVHNILNKCGGGIFVRSDPGEGTSVTLYLPAAAETENAVRDQPPAEGGAIPLRPEMTPDLTPEPLPEPAREHTAPNAPAPPPPLVQRRRILVIDDEPAILRLVEKALAEAEFDVLTLENGLKAAEMVWQRDIDLVITDLVMPEQEGLETIRELHELYPALPIIAMSGAFDGQFLVPSRLLGAQIALRKPFTIEQLLAAVRLGLSFAKDPTG